MASDGIAVRCVVVWACLVSAGWVGSASGQWAVNDRVEANVGGEWVRARITEVGTWTKVQVLEGNPRGRRGGEQTARGVRPIGGYAVGGRVEAEVFREWYPGTVTAVDDSWVTVRLDDPDVWAETRYRYDAVRPGGAAGGAAGGDGAAGAADDAVVPGMRVEVQAGSDWEAARVTTIERGLVHVEYEDEAREPRTRRVPPRLVRPLETGAEMRARLAGAGGAVEGGSGEGPAESGGVVRALALPTEAVWALEPVDAADGGSAVPAAEVRLRKAFDSVFYGVAGVAVRGGRPATFLVAHADGSPREARLSVQVGSLTGAARAAVPVSAGTRFVAASADLSRVLVAEEKWTDDWTLHVLAVGPGQALALASFDVPSQLHGDLSARFVEDEAGEVVAVVVVGSGVAMGYDLVAGRVGWRLDVPSFSSVSIDAATGYVVGAIDGELVVLDPATGAFPVYAPDRRVWMQRVAVSPDRRVVALASGGLELIDGETGRTVGVVSSAAEGSFRGRWLDEQYWLTDDGRVVDTRRLAVVWSVELPAADAGSGYSGGAYWSTAVEGDAVMLRVTPVFSDGLRARLEGIDDAAVASMWGFGRGAAVRLDMRVNDAALRERIEERLGDVGVTIADDAPYTLSVRITEEPSEEIEYGQGFDVVGKASFRPRVYAMELTEGGTPLWRYGSRQTAPGMISLEEGQTVGQVIAEAMRLDAMAFLGGVQFPERLPQARYLRGLGSSALGE